MGIAGPSLRRIALPRAVGLLLLMLGIGPMAAARTEHVRWVDTNAMDPHGAPIAGFRIYIGASPGNYDSVIDVELPSRPLGRLLPLYAYKIEVASHRSVYLALTAYDDRGRESAYSNESHRGAADTDLDGVPEDGAPGHSPCASGQTLDCDDNCPYAANPLQEDLGGIGSASEPDGIGDACQCGDVNADGRVTAADSSAILDLLFRSAPVARPELCDVAGSPGCSSTDASAVWRAQFAPGGQIRQQCPPAEPAGS